MPFFYKLRIAPDSPQYKLVSILEYSKEYLPAGEKLAVLEFNKEQFYLVSIKPGLISHWHIGPGDLVNGTTEIAHVVGEGEDLPHERYPLIQRIDDVRGTHAHQENHRLS